MPFTINEVVKKVNISAHTLRFYEKEGIMPSVNRDSKGNRIYNEEDIKWLECVLALRATGMPLSQMKHYVDLYKKGNSTIEERKEIMLQHKVKVEQQMLQSIKCLENINYKLALYNSPSLWP